MKNLFPPLTCNRCNDCRHTHVRCERDRIICDFEEYRDAIWDYFGKKFAFTKHYITMSGGVNAGKTLFLVSLIDKLLYDKETKLQLQRHGINNVEMIDPISLRNFKNIVDYCAVGKLQFTKIEEPLSFFSLFLFCANDKIHELVLYNTSGEKIEDEFTYNNIRTKAHELIGTATLHFVDPREDSALNRLLLNPKNTSKFGQCKDFDIVSYINKVMQYVNRGVLIVNNPIGICVSKFDLLRHLIPYNIPENHFVDLSVNIFEDIDSVSNELCEFLTRNSKTIDPNELQSKYRVIKYFPVASFGSDSFPPVWANRNPKGVLAPFLWLLKELEILPKDDGTY
jgi:hypothetical protein